MASLLFSVSILNYSKLSTLEKKMDENKMCCLKVDNQKNCSVNVKNEVEVFIKKLNNFVNNTEILIKNEMSKTILAVVNLQDKIVNVIEKKNKHENKNLKRNSDEVLIKLDNLRDIVERIYDFASLNENTRTNDNYNFYNLVKNQVIEYFEAKFNEMNKKTP